MTKVFTGASVSLDGYISGPAETGFEHLFTWYGNGDVEVPTANPEMTLRMSAVSAEHFRNIIDMTGALVVGRKLFDSTNAWGGKHPMDRLVVVVTRTDLGRRGHQRHPPALPRPPLRRPLRANDRGRSREGWGPAGRSGRWCGPALPSARAA